MKKLIYFFTAAALILAGCQEMDPDTVAEGSTGSISWNLNVDGTLTVSGSGAMAGYDSMSVYNPLLNHRLKIKTVIIKEGVTGVGKGYFYGCKLLSSVSLPASLSTIGEFAFAGCSALVSVTIPDSVTDISPFAFRGCSGLRSITLGAGLKRIGRGAFYDCKSLINVTVMATTPPVFYGAAENDKKDFSASDDKLYVPKGCYDIYFENLDWGYSFSYYAEQED